MQNPRTFPSQKNNLIQTAHHKTFDKTVYLLSKNSPPFQSSIFVKQNRRSIFFGAAVKPQETFDLPAAGAYRKTELFSQKHYLNKNCASIEP